MREVQWEVLDCQWCKWGFPDGLLSLCLTFFLNICKKIKGSALVLQISVPGFPLSLAGPIFAELNLWPQGRGWARDPPGSSWGALHWLLLAELNGGVVEFGAFPIKIPQCLSERCALGGLSSWWLSDSFALVLCSLLAFLSFVFGVWFPWKSVEILGISASPYLNVINSPLWQSSASLPKGVACCSEGNSRALRKLHLKLGLGLFCELESPHWICPQTSWVTGLPFPRNSTFPTVQRDFQKPSSLGLEWFCVIY